MLDIDTRTADDREDERIGFCICDFPTCETCDPEPDPEVIEFYRLVDLMGWDEAIAVMDARYLTEDSWCDLHV